MLTLGDRILECVVRLRECSSADIRIDLGLPYPQQITRPLARLVEQGVVRRNGGARPFYYTVGDLSLRPVVQHQNAEQFREGGREHRRRDVERRLASLEAEAERLRVLLRSMEG